jgi:hypothetical protein
MDFMSGRRSRTWSFRNENNNGGSSDPEAALASILHEGASSRAEAGKEAADTPEAENMGERSKKDTV